MDISYIKGYEEIFKHFGYFPTFHDDYIDSIEITAKKIIICIRMESSSVNIIPNSNEKLKLTLSGVTNFNFSGALYGCVSIIRDVLFHNNDEVIKTEILTSLGTEGTIYSKSIQIELI